MKVKLTRQDMTTLGALDRGMSASDIASTFHMSKSAVTRTVHRLEEYGLFRSGSTTAEGRAALKRYFGQ